MKTKIDIHWSLKWATWGYLLCTLMGVLFYVILPAGLNNFGGRSCVYLFWFAGLNEEISLQKSYVLLALAVILWIAILGIGVYCQCSKRYRLMLITVSADVVFDVIFLLWRDVNAETIILSVVLNMLYCFWLGCNIFGSAQKHKSYRTSDIID